VAEYCVGLVSPGEMGAAVAGTLVRSGRRVVSVLDGRSPNTIDRAGAAGIEEVRSLDALAARATVIVSIVPPAVATDVAHGLATAISSVGAAPLVVEANAVSPSRAGEMSRVIEQAGASFVDADLIGGPPGPGRTATRLYLSGPYAGQAADALGTPELRPVVLEGPPMAASSLKMAYAAWTKGSAALVLTARALARALGVEQALLAEWGDSQPDLADRCELAARGSGRAWRFAGEMDEIAATCQSAGLPAGFAQAAAEDYRRLAALKGQPAPRLEDVLHLLIGQ